jgi:ribA/ribD-fused uncharacterized protein
MSKTPFCFYGNDEKNGIAAFFSNFYPSPSYIVVDTPIAVPTSEHAFMLYKAYQFGDVDTFDKILDAKTPAEAKALGKLVKGFNPQVWDFVKYKYMKSALICKLNSISTSKLKQLVELSKAHYFVETSPTDNIWGVGVTTNGYLVASEEERKGFGQNLLGLAWDEVLLTYSNWENDES